MGRTSLCLVGFIVCVVGLFVLYKSWKRGNAPIAFIDISPDCCIDFWGGANARVVVIDLIAAPYPMTCDIGGAGDRWGIFWKPVKYRVFGNASYVRNYTIPLLVPSIILFATLLVTGSRLWLSVVRAQRMKHGLCLKCGYSLAGLTERRCPECGTEF